MPPSPVPSSYFSSTQQASTTGTSKRLKLKIKIRQKTVFSFMIYFNFQDV
jgi:hypothetical protein